MTTLGQTGEHEIIRRLAATLGTHPDLIQGVGDDCAVTHLPGTDTDQVFTTDPVIENVHFTSADNPERIGNKAAGRVLSDLAAMGARPQWLLVNVVASPELDSSVLDGIYSGMNALCRRFGAVIIGGDVAKGPCLELHVFGTGLLPSGSALLRSGAKVGDQIFVTGPLGCSREGKHLDFIPRVEEGIFLRESGKVGALMDISDGLATDLRHILKQSNVGAELDMQSIPKNGTLEQALYDGEDFELLFTLPSGKADALCREWSERYGCELHSIGEISDEPEVLKARFPDGECRRIEQKAFEHFSSGEALT